MHHELFGSLTAHGMDGVSSSEAAEAHGGAPVGKFLGDFRTHDPPPLVASGSHLDHLHSWLVHLVVHQGRCSTFLFPSEPAAGGLGGRRSRRVSIGSHCGFRQINARTSFCFFCLLLNSKSGSRTSPEDGPSCNR